MMALYNIAANLDDATGLADLRTDLVEALIFLYEHFDLWCVGGKLPPQPLQPCPALGKPLETKVLASAMSFRCYVVDYCVNFFTAGKLIENGEFKLFAATHPTTLEVFS
ncbi:hypothetical protein NpPPO83_00000381 [Neofusicoccum parvum]|uniref:Uncharacterized protein n=1 Tax=Neofusicoccum parvum TaxID=310453 RepID=A0ACB5SQK8_9PEZI|nr:hypothetical protein NpPPO83_00000381 [Neofusicoccum parvum]